MPACNTLFIGRCRRANQPASGGCAASEAAKRSRRAGWKAGEKQGLPIVIDIDQVHPLTQLVQMGNVKIGYATPLKGPPGTVTLIDCRRRLTPIYAIGPRGGYEDAVLGFDIVDIRRRRQDVRRTPIGPIRRSFPVFVMNALKYLGGVRSSLAAPNILPGSPAVLRTATPVTKVMVSSPRGDHFEVPRELQNTYRLQPHRRARRL